MRRAPSVITRSRCHLVCHWLQNLRLAYDPRPNHLERRPQTPGERVTELLDTKTSCHWRGARGWMKLGDVPPADVVASWRCVPVTKTDAGACPVGTPDCCCERVLQDLDLVAGSAGGAPVSGTSRSRWWRWISSIRASRGSTCIATPVARGE